MAWRLLDVQGMPNTINRTAGPTPGGAAAVSSPGRPVAAEPDAGFDLSDLDVTPPPSGVVGGESDAKVASIVTPRGEDL